MKILNLILITATILIFSNCAEDVEKMAEPLLNRAQQSYNQKQYALAKLQIDSIKQIYPKAFDTRAKAQELYIEVELAEAHIGKVYIDSLLNINQTKIPELRKGLYLDKDTRYQDLGTYYATRHRTEKNLYRTYLRPQTDENGVFTIVSFYRGQIKAHTLRFTAPDGSYIELESTTKPYIMNDAKGQTERTDFNATTGTALFIASHPTFTITLIGEDKKTLIPFSKDDFKSLTQITHLSSTLQIISTLQSEKQELERRIHFYEQRKMQ